MTEVGLGTVQLGLPYGANKNGTLMSLKEAFSILEHALEKGVRFFDTAPAYGESEKRLGEFGLAKIKGTQIATKIPACDKAIWSKPATYSEYVIKSLDNSLKTLKADKIYLLQFHHSNLDFLQSDSFALALEKLSATNAMTALGVSVYLPSEADFVVKHHPTITALQIPANIIDRRFNSFFNKESRIAISVARSIFLQGVLTDSGAIPACKKSNRLLQLRTTLKQLLPASTALTDVSLAYPFSSLANELKIGLLGVESVDALKENLAKIEQLKQDVNITYQALNILEKAGDWGDVLDPRGWDE